MRHFPTKRTGMNQVVGAWYASAVGAGGQFSGLSVATAIALQAALQRRPYYGSIQYVLPLLGVNLAAQLTPLIDRISAGRPSNANFVDADAVEKSGLQGNGSDKRLTLTGIKISAIGSSQNGGLGWWETNAPASSTTAFMGGYRTTTTAGFILYSSSGASAFRWGVSANSATGGPTITTAHYYGQRASATSRVLYVNGSSSASNTTSDTATGTGERDITFFGAQNDTSNFFWGGRAGLIYLTDGTLTADQISDLHSLFRIKLMVPMGRAT